MPKMRRSSGFEIWVLLFLLAFVIKLANCDGCDTQFQCPADGDDSILADPNTCEIYHICGADFDEYGNPIIGYDENGDPIIGSDANNYDDETPKPVFNHHVAYCPEGEWFNEDTGFCEPICKVVNSESRCVECMPEQKDCIEAEQGKTINSTFQQA